MKHRTLGLVAVLMWLTAGGSAVLAQPPDEAALRQRMTNYITVLDAPKSFAAGSWDEFIVLLYGRLQSREPTLREFALLQGLHRSAGLRASEALSLVLRGEEVCPTYSQIAAFLDSDKALRFVSTEATRAKSRELSEASAAGVWAEDFGSGPSGETIVKVAPDLPNLTYNVYYGYVHAHSGLSDGEGAPEEAYAAARASGMDYFSLADHGEQLLLWPWENKYARMRAAADAADAPGQFAALYGFEWGNPVLGHITVINADRTTDALRDFRLSRFFCWLGHQPDAVGIFNHPGGADDLGLEFRHGRLFAGASAQMVGMELWNKDSGFDRFYYGGSWENDLSYIDVMNRQGWRVGALGDGDNHGADWGQGERRTAVLALELTREAVLDAYRHRRFYSTEDEDLVLDFRCDGYPMGAVVYGASPEFTVAASDAGGDTFSEVRFYRDGELLETRAVDGNTVNATFAAASESGSSYYYVIIKQNDDNDGNGRNDEAISSPIWLGTPFPLDPPPVGCMGLGTTISGVNLIVREDVLILSVFCCILFLFPCNVKTKKIVL